MSTGQKPSPLNETRTEAPPDRDSSVLPFTRTLPKKGSEPQLTPLPSPCSSTDVILTVVLFVEAVYSSE